MDVTAGPMKPPSVSLSDVLERKNKRIAELEARNRLLDGAAAAVVDAYFLNEEVPHLHPSIDELRRALRA
jgi:hypothetical protein